MGIFFLVGGFGLFLYSEHRLRQLDIEQLIKKECAKKNE